MPENDSYLEPPICSLCGGRGISINSLTDTGTTKFYECPNCAGFFKITPSSENNEGTTIYELSKIVELLNLLHVFLKTFNQDGQVIGISVPVRNHSIVQDTLGKRCGEFRSSVKVISRLEDQVLSESEFSDYVASEGFFGLFVAGSQMQHLTHLSLEVSHSKHRSLRFLVSDSLLHNGQNIEFLNSSIGASQLTIPSYKYLRTRLQGAAYLFQRGFFFTSSDRRLIQWFFYYTNFKHRRFEFFNDSKANDLIPVGNSSFEGSRDSLDRRLLMGQSSTKIFIDCVFYQLNETGITKLWNEVFREWARDHLADIVLIDRGGAIPDYGFERVPFSPCDPHDYGNEVRSLDWLLCRHGIKRLGSTYYTFSSIFPVRAIIYDMIPETLGENIDGFLKLKKDYLNFAESIFCISKTSLEDVASIYPRQYKHSLFSYPPISPLFVKRTTLDKMKIRCELQVSREFLVVLPCPLDGYKDGQTGLLALEGLPYADRIEVVCTHLASQRNQIVSSIKNLKLRFERYEDKPYSELVAAADLLVWTPQIEGFGLPVLEALSCGTKVVIGNTRINRELYEGVFEMATVGSISEFRVLIDKELTRASPAVEAEQILRKFSTVSFSKNLFNFLSS